MKSYQLLLFVALFPCVFADQIDPPIPCKSTADCVDFSKSLKDAVCRGGHCVCKNGTEFRNCSSTEALRHENRTIGPIVFRTCKHHQDCTFNKGVCNMTINQCECQKDYVLSTNKHECLKKASGIAFFCVDEKQCLSVLPNTTCQDGQCACVPGYHNVNNVCYATVELGATCNNSQECSIVEGAVCTSRKTCGCPEETVINESRKKCLPVAREILQQCTEDVQCSTSFSDSHCANSTCQCEKEYHYESEMNRCFFTKGLDENCANSYECYQVKEENDNVTGKAVQCLSNKCVCAPNFYRDNSKCLNAAAQLAGSAVSFVALSILVQALFSQI